MANPMVSVAIITYNQEEYIEKALQSVIEQETEFDFEVIIGDDASSDTTSDICALFQQRYPGKITHLKNEKNLGYINNVLNVLNQCSGEYVALLEADDYWTSNTKLKDQVKVFQSHPDVTLCFTNSYIDDTLVPENKQYFHRNADMKFTAADCLENCVAPTSTFMFRRNLFTPPDWFAHLHFYEYHLIQILAGKGCIYYLNVLAACRTQHYRGISTAKPPGGEVLLSNVVHLAKAIELYPEKERKKVQNILLKRQIEMASHFIQERKFALAGELIKRIRIHRLLLFNRGVPVMISYLKLFVKYGVVKIKPSAVKPVRVQKNREAAL